MPWPPSTDVLVPPISYAHNGRSKLSTKVVCILHPRQKYECKLADSRSMTRTACRSALPPTCRSPCY